MRDLLTFVTEVLLEEVEAAREVVEVIQEVALEAVLEVEEVIQEVVEVVEVVQEVVEVVEVVLVEVMLRLSSRNIPLSQNMKVQSLHQILFQKLNNL